VQKYKIYVIFFTKKNIFFSCVFLLSVSRVRIRENTGGFVPLRLEISDVL